MNEIAAATAALARGELVIMPTETVYGLAADARNPAAVARVFEAKGRPRFNPLIAHVPDLAAAMKIAELPSLGVTLAQAFWPGPLTLIGKARPGGACDLARGGLDSVAVRVPDHPVALALLQAFGGPVAAPSANRSGRPSPTRMRDALEETGGSAALALEGGDCRVGLESTVVSLLGERPAILRAGGLTRGELISVVGELEEAPADALRSPGRLALHYAPDAPVRLNARSPEPGEAFLAFGPNAPQGERVWNLSVTADLREAAARLFACLREADRTRPTAIAVAPVPHHGLGEAINDRLRRAAGYRG
ncbi:L-threonylcarbamoyladenylate synthase [Caulobacter sp. S45]|uniref:L-threonylcarbamoyladenylate synthase n=1 Tax=Caulobacter sp. S45 TaxID=1641861 RepID=UPI00211315E6|nr:L-threonylcarbamoyladenylate synthase [Caulobacter sp. S45]